MPADQPSREPANADRIDLLGMFRRRAWVLVLFVVLGVGLGHVLSGKLPVKYSSTTSVLVSPIGLPTLQSGSTLARAEAPLNLETESQVVLSEPVATAAAALAGDKRPIATVISEMDVQVPPNTTVLSITATTSNAAHAQALSAAFAKAYIDDRNTTAQAAVTSATTSLTAQLDALNKQLQAVSSQIATIPAGNADRTFAEAQQQILVTQVAAVSSDLTRLKSTQITPGNVLVAATPGEAPGLPLGKLATLAGGLLGLVLGFLAMLLLERLDRRLHRGIDVERLAGVPLLGELPKIKRKDRSLPVTDALGDGYGPIRNEVAARLPAGGGVLLVVPVGSGGAIATTNLAAAFSRAGELAVLVCADLSDAGAANTLGIAPGVPGLADALRGDVATVPLLPCDVDGLSVLAPGTDIESARDLLQGPRFVRVVTDASVGSDLLLVQAPSSTTGSDAQTMARAASAVVLVVEVGRTDRSDLVHAAAQFDRMGARVLGAVALPTGSEARNAARPASRRAPAMAPAAETILSEGGGRMHVSEAERAGRSAP